ncbi:MAG: hypothetical protein IJ060_11425 [Oscillospiraceae bacterium]|nr:hypothetical protein [Oscillospiraceae bacterium]
MLSFPLLKQSVKSNSVMWGSMTGVMTLLCIQFSTLDMTRSLLFQIFYGMMTTILPGIYVLVTANKLLASQVDRGSMAYVLSTPVKRSTVTVTQAFYLVNSLILMFGIQTGAHLLVNRANPVSLATFGYTMLSGDLTSKMILQVNLSALMVCIALAAVCFMFSGIFSSTKYSIGLSGTFIGVNILANMLAMFGRLGVSGLDKFKYLTIVSFYDYQSVLFKNSDWVQKLIFPAVIALAAFTVGQLVFRKKDLPL